MPAAVTKTIGPDETAARRWELAPRSRMVDPRRTAREWATSKAEAKAARLGVELGYRAALPSEYHHDAGSLGGTADAHYAHGLDLWNIREKARAYDRDDPNVGQLTERGLDNILGSGLQIDPQTSDKALNDTLRDLWRAWADSAATCDFSGRFTFDELERLALRHTWVDGDAFFVLDERSGSVRFEEGDRVMSWDTVSDDIVHGVKLDGVGRPVSYLFRRLRPGERKRHTIGLSPADLVEVPAAYVIHVYFPRRATQTRGVSAFAPVFDQIGLASDIEHARLVKLQVSSCIAGFIHSDYPGSFYLGGQDSTASGMDGTTDLEFGEFSPGMIGKLRGGQKFEGFSPDVVSNEEDQFCEQAVRRVGLAIGLPLELSMLTAKNQSYSALRGVVEQYKIGARVSQRRYAATLRSRVYAWKVGHWIEAGLVKPRADVLKHHVLTPAWPYIDPMVDAQADALRVEKHLASLRQVWAERGRDFDQGVLEIATDNAALVTALAAKAVELAKLPGLEDVTWRDLLAAGSPMEMPTQMQVEQKGAAA